MVSFSFLETLFFLILGTTFVLILLLVYHFKKRISDIEFRFDKLFTMVKCLAEEIQSQPKTTNGINSDIYPLNMSPENITAFKNVNLNVKLPNEIDVYDIIEEDEIDDDEEVESENEEDDEDVESEDDEDDDDDDDGDENNQEINSDLLSNGEILVKKIEQQSYVLESFKKMTVNELKNIAIKRNIEVSNKMKKNELIELLSK